MLCCVDDAGCFGLGYVDGAARHDHGTALATSTARGSRKRRRDVLVGKADRLEPGAAAFVARAAPAHATTFPELGQAGAFGLSLAYGDKIVTRGLRLCRCST